MKLRNATSQDIDFLYRLHRAAMKEYVTQTWGWDEAWQQNHFLQTFNSTACQIITVDGEEIGVLIVEEREGELFLRNVEILPEYQKKGVGTLVLTTLLEESKSKAKPIRLQVLKVNPARNLYERLGFSVTGETVTHYEMTVKAVG